MQKIKINKKISIFSIQDRDLFTTLVKCLLHLFCLKATSMVKSVSRYDICDLYYLCIHCYLPPLILTTNNHDLLTAASKKTCLDQHTPEKIKTL